MKTQMRIALTALPAGLAAGTSAQTAQLPPMPYVANHHPEFVAGTEATFLQDDDIVLGVASGKVAKA